MEERTGNLGIIDWEDFEKVFVTRFLLVNAEADAINTLEGTNYYQGSRSVDDYLDDFKTTIAEAGYTDACTIVVKFRRGL